MKGASAFGASRAHLAVIITSLAKNLCAWRKLAASVSY
jgi:hypothetical protein